MQILGMAWTRPPVTLCGADVVMVCARQERRHRASAWLHTDHIRKAEHISAYTQAEEAECLIDVHRQPTHYSLTGIANIRNKKSQYAQPFMECVVATASRRIVPLRVTRILVNRIRQFNPEMGSTKERPAKSIFIRSVGKSRALGIPGALSWSAGQVHSQDTCYMVSTSV